MRGTRLLLIAAATVLVAPLVGCTSDDAAAPASSTAGSTPPAPGTSAPLSSPPASARAQSRVIATTALLQPADLGGARLEPLPEGQTAHLRPVRPCDARYPSDATRTSAVAMRAQVDQGAGVTPAVVIQYVGLHPGKATEAFAEITAAVKRCPGSLQPDQRQWRTAATGIAGDESMLLLVSERVEYGDTEVTVTTPAAVVRVGDYITVVADVGWETASGDEQRVRQLAGKAAERLAANT